MKKFLTIIAMLGVIGYGLFEARRLIQGPTLVVETPHPGSATSSALVTVAGEAHNISFLTINDKPAYTDEAGKFVYRFSPPPGYTVVTVAAADRFGRRVSKEVPITILNYCPLS